MSALLLALVAAASPATQCHKIHYREDGTVQESWIPAEEVTETQGNATSVHARSSGPGSASSSSSVSVASHGGKTVSRSSANAADDHRSISVTNDENGCTVVIDDRPAKGDDR